MIYRFCERNTQYYAYCGKELSTELIERDLEITPPGIPMEQKYYVGFFENSKLVAIMDLEDGYPDSEYVYIGFFMMNSELQGLGIGTEIISEALEYLRKQGFLKCQLGIDKDNSKIITCHLGNGCSISAIKDGVCVDTTMGFTPLDGFMMGTRSGTLDPSALTYIAEKEGLTFADIDAICNKKSGVLGISGVSNDNRDVDAAAKGGNERAKLAIDMQRYQILKFVGSYIAAMNGVDTIVFTGGIGENDEELREYICENLGYLGVKLNAEANRVHGEEIKISTDDSKVNVYIIPTNEELKIARDTKAIVEAL